MASREFADTNGVCWTVWSVTPGEMSSTLTRLIGVSSERRMPWLAFLSDAGEKRRLVPPPPGWEDCDDARLEELSKLAAPVPPAPARRSNDRSPPD